MSDDIQRHHSNERLSRVVVHNGVVYVAGCTATDRSGDAQAHTADILKKIDGYLESVGTNKKRLLSVQIWLQDIERDFAGLNAAWAEWVPKDAMPTRATCETKLAAPDLRVEIIVTAALRAFSLEARRKLLNPLRPCAWRSIRHAQRGLPRLKATFADRPRPR